MKVIIENSDFNGNFKGGIMDAWR